MNQHDVLFVEDNPHDVELVLDTMKEFNINSRVCVMRNGAEAYDYFFGSEGCLRTGDAHLPKLILLDLKLPKISGLEFLKHIKADERTRHVPTVIFTSSNETEDRAESYLRGVNSYIVKPLNADLFSRFVKDIMSYWVSLNTTVYDQ
jgi:two-component system response regulator